MMTLATAILTGSTCGDACWHAREDICRCSCAGKNHGILTQGGTAPVRNSKVQGEFFELVAVIQGRGDGECWMDAFKRTDAERERIVAERFPGVDPYAYGQRREGKVFPVIDRKPSPTQLKWPEVAAVPNAYRLIWARPTGSPYLKRGDDHKAAWCNLTAESEVA